MWEVNQIPKNQLMKSTFQYILGFILCWPTNYTSSSKIRLLPVNSGHNLDEKNTKKQNPIPSFLAVVTTSFELRFSK